MINFLKVVAGFAGLIAYYVIAMLCIRRSNSSAIHTKPVTGLPKASPPPAPISSCQYNWQKMATILECKVLPIEGTFPSCDSISLHDQLKRLEAKKEFWEGRYFHFHRKMGKTLSMEDYFEYGRHADDARHNIRIFEDQIFYLKSAMSATSRTVGNYESKIKNEKNLQ